MKAIYFWSRNMHLMKFHHDGRRYKNVWKMKINSRSFDSCAEDSWCQDHSKNIYLIVSIDKSLGRNFSSEVCKLGGLEVI